MTLDYLLRLSDAAFTGPMKRARDEQGKFVAGGQGIAKTNGLVNGLGGSFAKLTPLIMTAGAALAAAALAGVGFAVKTAASTEQTMIQFETLTGSMQQAKATLAELQDLGASTPFELPQLTEAAKKLLAARVPTAALKSELTALGNVSAATGADLGNLATVYGQMAGKGKIYAEDMQQFVEAGAGEIKQVLAESLGVSTAALNDLMSEGRVGFSDMQKALQSLAGASGKWGESMAKQSQSTIGMLSTIKDNITGIFRELGQPINDGPVKVWLTSAVNASASAGRMIAAGIQQGRAGELLYHSLVLGAKMGVDEVFAQVRKLPSYLSSTWEAISKAMMAALTGNFDVVKSTLKGVMDGTFQTDKSPQMKFFAELKKGIAEAGKETAQAAKATDDWAKSMDAVTAAGDKSEAKAKASAGGSEAEGRKRIRSLRDGSTVAKSSERNTAFGADSQWKQLQQRVLSGPNEGQFANPAFGGKGYGPQGKARMMGSGLDAWHAANPGETNRFKRPLAVAPAIQSPGAAQVNEKKAATAAKTAEKIQGGGGDRPRWDLVAQIAANTANLKVIK